tara:strand:+ start:281 stop:628 length:348 start_codon:yes stop_codon:yes gene_type:complete
MKKFLLVIANVGTLLLVPSVNAMSHQNGDMKTKDFDNAVEARLLNLSQKRSCIEDAKNLNQIKSCRKKSTKYQEMDFKKVVKKKIKKIDKMESCVEKASDFKDLKSCNKGKKIKA